MALRHILSDSLAPLVDLIYPPRCPLCGGGTAQQGGLCSACWSELEVPGEPACSKCQRPFAGAQMGEDAICAPCMADPPIHAGIAAGTLYNDASRKLVLAFKHGHRIALAPMLARLIMARLARYEGDWVIVPVPLHRWRLWRRGFNQAALLAREIAKSRGDRLLLDGLQRVRATPSLGGLGRKERAKALNGAITITPRARKYIEGRNIILVDDVFTSGATSTACVKALKRAGARNVVIACFARVMDEAKGLKAASSTPSGQKEAPETMEVPGAT
ncbi:MAG: ComF family protein [Sphingomonadaceae bacterium]|nr:ComF family protein [Sphingomonadaceae bacterium]